MPAVKLSSMSGCICTMLSFRPNLIAVMAFGHNAKKLANSLRTAVFSTYSLVAGDRCSWHLCTGIRKPVQSSLTSMARASRGTGIWCPVSSTLPAASWRPTTLRTSASLARAPWAQSTSKLLQLDFPNDFACKVTDIHTAPWLPLRCFVLAFLPILTAIMGFCSFCLCAAHDTD